MTIFDRMTVATLWPIAPNTVPLTPEATLSHIHIRCERMVEKGTEALQDRFTTSGAGDDPTARTMLTKAVSAAVALRDFLDANWEFGFDAAGFDAAEPKEETCRE